MREIKFKAKRTDNGEWVEGFYSVIGEQSVIIKSNAEGYYDENLKERHGNEVIKIDPETVCQYTGMVDKNGVEIFEGDILVSHFDDIYPENETFLAVFWNVNKWKIKEKGSTTDIDDADELEPCDAENAEIIGNIFDNPELLEAEE